jgi:hypothetical protein
VVSREVTRALALVAIVAIASVAHAHSTLVRALPAARSTVKAPPGQIQLWFSERLEPAYSSASVWQVGRAAERTGAGAPAREASDVEMQRMDRGDAALSPQDDKLLTVALPALAPGKYVVRYRVLSVDGHVVEGNFPFTVTGGK